MPRVPAPARTVLATMAVLVLAACGGDTGEDGPGGSSGSSGDRPVRACGDLTDADVERLTGVAVTHEPEKSFAGVVTCTFVGDGTPVVAVVAMAGSSSIEELVEEAALPESEIETEEVDVPGTDAAALVRDTSYGSTTTSLVAATDSGSYTVYGSGPTSAEEGRVAVAALTILLGGTSDDPGVGLTEHPCDVLTGDEVASVVGGPVEAERQTLGSDSAQCAYTGTGIDVTMFDLDRTAPLEAVVGLQRSTGSDVEELDVDGLLAAYVVQKEEVDSVDVYVAAPGGTFGLSVRADDRVRSADVARDLLPLLVP